MECRREGRLEAGGAAEPVSPPVAGGATEVVGVRFTWRGRLPKIFTEKAIGQWERAGESPHHEHPSLDWAGEPSTRGPGQGEWDDEEIRKNPAVTMVGIRRVCGDLRDVS